MGIPREIPLPNTPCQQTHKTTKHTSIAFDERYSVCVWLGSESGPSKSPSVLSVMAQCAGAGVSGLHHGPLACLRIPHHRVSLHTTQQHTTLCACVPLMVSCSGFGLPMHAQLLRLFVTCNRPRRLRQREPAAARTVTAIA